MYGLTRATTTLGFSAGAGLLIWFATHISNDNTGGYWARVGLVGSAGPAVPRLRGEGQTRRGGGPGRGDPAHQGVEDGRGASEDLRGQRRGRADHRVAVGLDDVGRPDPGPRDGPVTRVRAAVGRAG